MMRVLGESRELDVVGTVRSDQRRTLFPAAIASRLVVVKDAQDQEQMSEAFERLKPDVVINCVAPSRQALIKQDPLQVIPICALLPHQLALLSGTIGARLVQISTDGVYSGSKGCYTEDDPTDATDVYGVAKSLGELRHPHTVTLRTSIIGHELGASDGLLSWFLSQDKRCNCFNRAVFSGLPAVVLAQIVRDVVLPHPELCGVFHVAAEPITKCDLLALIARIYGKSIEIVPDDTVVIDRSLNPERFRMATGYVAPDWPTMIQTMHSSR
jgi:dTDP-4-dehydrorhamnose reductase